MSRTVEFADVQRRIAELGDRASLITVFFNPAFWARSSSTDPGGPAGRALPGVDCFTQL